VVVARGCLLRLAAEVFHWFVGSRRCRLGGQDVVGLGGPQARVNSSVQAVSQGQCSGRWRVIPEGAGPVKGVCVRSFGVSGWLWAGVDRSRCQGRPEAAPGGLGLDAGEDGARLDPPGTSVSSCWSCPGTAVRSGRPVTGCRSSLRRWWHGAVRLQNTGPRGQSVARPRPGGQTHSAASRVLWSATSHGTASVPVHAAIRCGLSSRRIRPSRSP
jgi:hypothetical protein